MNFFWTEATYSRFT